MGCNTEYEQAEQGTGQAHEKAGGQKLAEKNPAGNDAEARLPTQQYSSRMRQHDQCDDVLDSPGLTPGRGKGIAASIKANPIAAAARRAMR